MVNHALPPIIPHKLTLSSLVCTGSAPFPLLPLSALDNLPSPLSANVFYGQPQSPLYRNIQLTFYTYLLLHYKVCFYSTIFLNFTFFFFQFISFHFVKRKVSLCSFVSYKFPWPILAWNDFKPFTSFKRLMTLNPPPKC